MPADPSADPVLLPAAVLWDMDGTLIDSERLWEISLQDTAQELGGTMSAAARDRLVGCDLPTSLGVLLAEVGRPATPELVAFTRDRLIDRTATLLAAGVDWLPGAHDALRLVREAGVPTALVTNTGRRLAELALDRIGRHFFDVTVCGDEVPVGKPAPDPYLRAAALLDVPVTGCVAVEDSPNGALSAERAGAAVLVVAGPVPVPAGPRRTHRADLVGLTTAELAAAVRTPDPASAVA
jgi:HAD superfamily hydrolase (TIGR01509 family)